MKTAEAEVKKREEAVTGAEKTKAANTIGDGTWTVGTDIEPVTYRATADVGSSCYGGIYATGSNGSIIIERLSAQVTAPRCGDRHPGAGSSRVSPDIQATEPRPVELCRGLGVPGSW